MKGDFVRILPLSADTDPPDEQGWRLKLFREKGQSLVELDEQQVWPEKMHDVNAQHVRKVQASITLNEDARAWLLHMLMELDGEIVDIEALKHEIAQLRHDYVDSVGLRQALDEALGPHCSSCGNPIDPDTCHCGEDVKRHETGYEGGHGFCPMGCVCGYEPDWERIAKARGELLWATRGELSVATPVFEAAKQLIALTREEPMWLDSKFVRDAFAKLAEVVDRASVAEGRRAHAVPRSQ